MNLIRRGCDHVEQVPLMSVLLDIAVSLAFYLCKCYEHFYRSVLVTLNPIEHSPCEI